MIHKMTGALIVGVSAWALGNTGIVIGLLIAFVYYGKTTKD